MVALDNLNCRCSTSLPPNGCGKRLRFWCKKEDNPFRIAAYRKAADAVAALTTDVRELLETSGIKALQAIPGIGPRIAGGLASLRAPAAGHTLRAPRVG